MTEKPRIALSAVGDEAAHQKTAVQQFAALAALGLQYYSLRQIDVGEGIKDVLKLSKGEIQAIRHLEDEYGLNVGSLATSIGGIKLTDASDGSQREFVPFKKYLDRDIKRACEMAHAFETKLVGGFSFFPPRGVEAAECLPQAVDQLGQIAEVCLRSDLTFGASIAPESVGHNAVLMSEIVRQVNHPALVVVFDAGQLACQGYSAVDVFEQFQVLKGDLGWLRISDYRPGGKPTGGGAPDRNFVPLSQGTMIYEAIFRELAELLPKLDARLRRRGIPGVFLELEPQLAGGNGDEPSAGSGPDSLGVALRALCRVLDHVQLDYHLRDFDDIRAARGWK